MGKLLESTTATTPRTTIHSAGVKAPTTEQIRMAQLLVDPKSEDHSVLKDKVQKVIELTRCDENSALVALHDCDNDVEQAVDLLLEGGQFQDEWVVQESKKTKKQMHTDPSGRGGDEFDTSGMYSANKRSGGSGNWIGNRGSADGPPRMRGRGRGGLHNRENGARGDFDSGEFDGFSRNRGRGGGGMDRGRRGRGFGGPRGGRRGRGFSQNGGGGSGAQMESWNPTATPDNNTWDNSMANTVNNGVSDGKYRWENSNVQASNDYDWGGEEDLSKLRDGLIVEPSYAQKSVEKIRAPGSGSVTPAPPAPVNAAPVHGPQSTDPTRVRGESIDVNSLFTASQPVMPSSLTSSKAWTSSNMQATADLKNELGIGKVASPAPSDTAGPLHRPTEPTNMAKQSTAKVELPLGRLPASAVPIDVQFGDMALSSDASQALFDIHPSAGYQTQPSVVSHKDRPVQQSVHQPPPSSIYQRSIAGGDHAHPSESSGVAHRTDVAPKGASSGAPGFVPSSQPDQHTIQEQKPIQHPHPPQHQQQYTASRVSQAGMSQVGSQKATNAGVGGLSSDQQRGYYIPTSSSSVGPNMAQQAMMNDSIMRDDSGASGNVPTSAVQAVSKHQVSSGNQPVAPYQQAMANLIPYLGMTYDHSGLNSIGYLQAQNLLVNAGGLDMRAVNAVGRDGGEMKPQGMRQENGTTIPTGAGATGNVSNLAVPPPGLPAPNVSNAEQAAQLLNLGFQLHQLQFVNPASPYMQPQFYVPSVSSASGVTSGNQYQRTGGYQGQPALFSGSGYEELQQAAAQLDYGKPNYGVLPPGAQGKTLSAGGGPSAMSLPGTDVGNKYGGAMKMSYDSKQFATAGATPPPLGNMNFSPAATGPAQYGYPSYLHPQIMNMITGPAMPSNAQMSNDLLSQRGMNQNGKPAGGPSGVVKGISQQYPYGGPWGN